MFTYRFYLLFAIIQTFLLGCTLFEKEFILPRPTAIEADQVSAVSFQAHWKRVTGAISYEIDVSEDKTFTSFVTNYQDRKVTGTSIVIEGLEAGQPYFYRVRANISNQTSINSNIIEVTTDDLALPIAYPATEVSSTGFRVHWKKMQFVSMYELDVALDESFNKFLAGYKALKVPAEDTTVLLSNVIVNTQYFYRVRVKQSSSFSAYSNIQSVFTSTLPRPVVLPASKVQLTSFMANWVAMPEAVAYRIDVAKDALFQQILPGYDNLSVKTNSLVIPNLDANTDYFYRVRAVNNEATSNHSDVMTVTTQNLPLPTATAATKIQSGGFQANWDVLTNAASYLLDVALDQNFTRILPSYNGIAVLGSFATVNGLDASTTYFYRVRAKGLNATSDYSNVIQVTTGLLAAPVAKDPTRRRAFGFKANWEPQTDISLYLLDVATDPGFANLVTGYDAKEVAGNSQRVEGLDFRTTYYYRLRSKKLTKTSAYSNTIQVAPCVSNTCKVDSLIFYTGGANQAYDQKFTYDAQHRITEINYYDQPDLRYTITYNADNTINRVSYIFNGSAFYEYIYTYDANQLLTSVRQNDRTGAFRALWRFTYNAQRQRTSWSIFSDVAGTTLTRSFNYVYDERGNVTSVTDQGGTVIRTYTYDNKLSPYAIFNQPDLAFFIATSRDQWTGVTVGTVDFVSEWRGFLPVNNIIREAINGISTEVFIFVSNPKDIATAQDGFFSVEYKMTGCSF